MTSKENKQGLFDSLGRASVMGLHMVSGIIVGCLLGYWLDTRILLRQGEQDDAGKKRQK